MATKSIEIKCLAPKCGKWFNSPIFFGDIRSFDISVMTGNIVQCPHCNSITPCNKENMRVRADEGGFLGSDT